MAQVGGSRSTNHLRPRHHPGRLMVVLLKVLLVPAEPSQGLVTSSPVWPHRFVKACVPGFRMLVLNMGKHGRLVSIASQHYWLSTQPPTARNVSSYISVLSFPKALIHRLTGYCGNTLTNNGATGAVISSSSCNSNCGGDASQKCGGGWTLSVFKRSV